MVDREFVQGQNLYGDPGKDFRLITLTFTSTSIPIYTCFSPTIKWGLLFLHLGRHFVEIRIDI